MKKKLLLSCAILALVITVTAWLFVRPKALGNINASFSEQTTSVSEFVFSAKQGDRVKFSFRSDIQAGTLDIVVCDSNGNIIYELDHADALETYTTFNNTDTYILQAQYTGFIGKFKIAVYSANK